MSQPTDHPSAETDPTIPPEASLPEVQPPSAAFIVQLFIIPGLIVFVIIMVWLMFTWLAHMGSDPQSYIAEMRQDKPNSWQQAYNLSEVLRQNEEHRKDPALAKEVADFLNELLDKPLPNKVNSRSPFTRDPRNEEIQRRGFLCKTLGEFLVADDALPVLIKAARSHDDEDDLRIQLAALEAIALLAENMRATKPLNDDALMSLLLASSQNPDHKIALRAAIALAAVGGPQATERLEQMLQEPQHVDVHYNVATGLARAGNPAAIDMLLEMLDPENQRGVAGEPNVEAEAYKRAVIYFNGLKATRLLAERNADADLTPLAEAIQRLLDKDLEEQIRMEADSTLAILQQRRRASTAG